MANQPKKYKKFVATAATATLVASAIVPVASAAEFKDVTGNDHEVAINALAEEGIIKGYADGTFKPNQTVTRGQVVKLLGRWLETLGEEVPADWKTEQRFTDVATSNQDEELVKYAALTKDANVFNGSNGNLNAAQTMTRQQMALVLVRAIKEIAGVDLVADFKEDGHVTEISDLDKAHGTEQRNAIVALEYAEITKVSTFNPGNSITRGQFASFLYRTINVLEADETGVSTVKAINNTTVEVTFADEVEDVKALDFAIEGLEISNAAVKQTNKKVVVLTTSAQTGDKEYTVTLDGEEIGSFKGITAVIPTKVEVVDQSVQGKLGQQVTVKAQVTVAEGASKAGIPVTLFVPGSADGIKAPVTVEALTDENGVATHTYTRYAATTDNVTVYATGDRSKFSTGYVFWGVDTILAIEEVTTGATINNGANKTYKVTFKNPTTGKVEANKTLNVSFAENINVTADKVKNASVNGVNVKQLSNGSIVEAAQITTDSKGEATFTVSGTNTEITPVVYVGETTYSSTNSSTVTGYSKKYEASSLQTTAAKVKFAAVQAEYAIELTRDGGEVAANGYANGRKYNVVVKDKDGKLAANEIVNVAINENIDRVISTTSNAEFIKLNDDGDKVGYNGTQITVKTNSKGEASFYIGNEGVNTYATPVAWIDINSSNAKNGQLDEGEPTTVGQISYFQNPYVDGAAIKVTDTNGKKKSEFDGEGPAVFNVNLTNQSGEEYKLGTSESIRSVSYTVFNTGANDVYVVEGTTKRVISPNRSYTLTNFGTGNLEVFSDEGKTTSVKVVATGVARYYDEDLKTIKDFNFNAKEATAKFTATNEISNPYTGVINLDSINTDKKTIAFEGKKAVKYAGEDGKTYKYNGIGNTTISNASAFIAVLEAYKADGQSVRVTYEVKDDVITFSIVAITSTTTPGVSQATKDLAAAIKKVEDAKLEEAEYTAESWKAYNDALVAAKAVASNATDAVKKEKTDALIKAYEALVKKTPEVIETLTITEFTATEIISPLLGPTGLYNYNVTGTIAEGKTAPAKVTLELTTDKGVVTYEGTVKVTGNTFTVEFGDLAIDDDYDTITKVNIKDQSKTTDLVIK